MPRPPNEPDNGIHLVVKPDMATKKFAEMLRKARVEAGKTQAEVAEKMGLLQARVAKLEAGQNEPTLTTVAKYAKAIGWRFSIHLAPTPRKGGSDGGGNLPGGKGSRG